MADCILALRQAPKPRQTRPKQQEKMERKEQRRPHETAGDLLDPHHGEGGVDPRFDDSIPF
jgi:hypothetical protein